MNRQWTPTPPIESCPRTLFSTANSHRILFQNHGKRWGDANDACTFGSPYPTKCKARQTISAFRRSPVLRTDPCARSMVALDFRAVCATRIHPDGQPTTRIAEANHWAASPTLRQSQSAVQSSVHAAKQTPDSPYESNTHRNLRRIRWVNWNRNLSWNRSFENIVAVPLSLIHI